MKHKTACIGADIRSMIFAQKHFQTYNRPLWLAYAVLQHRNSWRSSKAPQVHAPRLTHLHPIQFADSETKNPYSWRTVRSTSSMQSHENVT